jgi:Uma2 family endonuclease
MGMADPDTTFYTADMVRDLIVEDRAWPRYETLYGELVVTPAPRGRHQYAVGELFGELRTYLKRERLGVPFMSPADISWGRRDVLVPPDVFVVENAAWAASRTQGGSWDVVRHLLLAVEIISPSSARHDRFAKRRLYQQQRVPLYWAIDLETLSAEAWTPSDELPRVERERLVWSPDGASEPFVLPLAALVDES